MNERLERMGELAQSSVLLSLEELHKGKRLAEKVIQLAADLRKLEEEVSDLVLDILARFQPVASDLRYTKSALEISYGYYRLGRYALDITQAIENFGDQTACDHSRVDGMAKITIVMIEGSTQAFLNLDDALAKRVAAMDDQVDNLYREAMNSLSALTGAEPKCLLSEALVLKYLERIADHTSLIADSVFYIVHGKHITSN